MTTIVSTAEGPGTISIGSAELRAEYASVCGATAAESRPTLEEGALQGGENLETASQVRPFKVKIARRCVRIGRISTGTAKLLDEPPEI